MDMIIEIFQKNKESKKGHKIGQKFSRSFNDLIDNIS